MLYKVCSKCWINKPASEFYKRKDRLGWNWIRSSCKECERLASKTRQKILRDSWYYNIPEIKERKKATNKEYEKRNRKEINYRARQKNRRKYYDIRYRLMKLRQSMKYRCYNTKCPKYKWYGGKWIIIERNSFDEFYTDMCPSYKEHVEEFWYWPKYTQIDRIDPNGNYSKHNCRWVTAKENNSYNHEKEFSY